MKKLTLFKFFLVSLLINFYFSSHLHAQVLVGSTHDPEKAYLLEIRDRQITSPSSVTSSENISTDRGGLGLSRVQLKDIYTLEPFIETNDQDWIDSATTKIKEKHAGLMVYNIYVSPPTETTLSKQFKQGVYIWNGNQWEIAGTYRQKSYFYMPAFNLPVREITGDSDEDVEFNLYNEYARQFTNNSNNLTFVSNASRGMVPSPLGSRLYQPDELDYAVTYYDNLIMDITGIGEDGTITYRVKDNDPGPTSFINIVFIIKETE